MHETTPKSTDHWQFALACAVEWIRQKVGAFNFEDSLSGHAAYVGINPQRVIANIDGFLAEKDIVPGGTVNELEYLRVQLLENITPAYQAGVTSAHNLWINAQGDEQRTNYVHTTPEEVAAEARNRIPSELNPSQANWFVEGFCYTWAQEWFAFAVSHLDSLPYL